MRNLFKSNSKILFFTISLFMLGILYYWLVREATIASKFLGIKHFTIETITFRMDWFPSFVHQFSFIIFTWIVLERKYLLFPIFFWLIVNMLFEFGQDLSREYIDFLPKVFFNYFQQGTYCHYDILAIIIATVLAYFIMIQYQKKGE